MKKVLLCVAICGALSQMSLTAGPLDNLLTNGSFEEGVFQLPETHAYSQQIRDQGWTVNDPVTQPEGWCVTPLPGESGAFRLVEEPTESHSGLRAVYLKGHLIQERMLDVAGGRGVAITFWARSDTNADVTLKLYAYGRNSSGEEAWLDELKDTQLHSVGMDWQQITEKVKIPEQVNGEAVAGVKAVLYSSQGAFFDDVEVAAEGNQ